MGAGRRGGGVVVMRKVPASQVHRTRHWMALATMANSGVSVGPEPLKVVTVSQRGDERATGDAPVEVGEATDGRAAVVAVVAVVRCSPPPQAVATSARVRANAVKARRAARRGGNMLSA